MKRVWVLSSMWEAALAKHSSEIHHITKSLKQNAHKGISMLTESMISNGLAKGSTAGQFMHEKPL